MEEIFTQHWSYLIILYFSPIFKIFIYFYEKDKLVTFLIHQLIVQTVETHVDVDYFLWNIKGNHYTSIIVSLCVSMITEDNCVLKKTG